MSASLPALSFTGFSQFMKIAGQFPQLSKEDECMHALTFIDSKDEGSYSQLILSNLKFVARITMKFSGYGIPLIDLAQEGVIGLMKAINKFDPTSGVRLVSFAVHWIKSEIHEYIVRNFSMMKIATTKPQRKLFFNKRRLKSTTNSLTLKEANTIASELNITSGDVIEMEKRIKTPGSSLDASVGIKDDDSYSLIDTIASSDIELSDQIEEQEIRSHNSVALNKGLSLLDERSSIIIRSRWLAKNKATLSELSDELSISIERVRQLEKIAMDRLSKTVDLI
ncbi:RNA polymerase factor sigma-32 [Psychromonas sp. SP041]|uniref:RNA polymerase factor sigma-32 n=1 Tax=Psychromonas sp. SP041 TaxID=1365007 RepID=UPI0010C7E060|nr:RNA polymerase factor sigma-32 [Psychromonas sp. SP041]